MGFRLRGLEVGLLQRLDCLCTGILEPVGVGFGEKTEDSKTSYSKKLGDQYGRKKKRMSSHTKGTLLPVVQPRVQAEKRGSGSQDWGRNKEDACTWRISCFC